MKTKIEWRNNVNFSVNTESGHQISLDGPIESGGNNNGARPTELLISGMGGCTAFDVICIAKQKGKYTCIPTQIPNFIFSDMKICF